MKLSIPEAYNNLGLANDSTLEEVKTRYRKLALQNHPDKGGDVEEFLKVSNAYETLTRHFDNPTPSYNPYGYDQDDFEYEDGSDDEEDFSSFAFAEFLFEEFFTRGNYRPHYRHHHGNHHHSRQYGSGIFGGGFFPSFMSMPKDERPQETDSQFRARMARDRAERAENERQRKIKENIMRAEAETARREEREQAAQRRQEKYDSRKAASLNAAQLTAQRAKDRVLKAQKLRSQAFNAARQGDSKAVRKFVFEDGGEADGGELVTNAIKIADGDEEVLQQLEDIIGCHITPSKANGHANGEEHTRKKDLKETLVHIAVSQGDLELVKWLLNNSGTPEDQDARGYTPFHRAILSGNVPLMKYFFENYPPDDGDNEDIIYPPSLSESIIMMACRSLNAEAIDFVLDDHSTIVEVSEAWNWCSKTLAKIKSKPKIAAFQDCLAMLEQKTGFKAPSPTGASKSQQRNGNGTDQPKPSQTPSKAAQTPSKTAQTPSKANTQTPTKTSAQTPKSQPITPASSNGTPKKKNNNRKKKQPAGN